MDTLLHTITSGPAVNSPSDLSYSSGPSRTSTRNTSPDSVVAIPLQPCNLLDLNVKAAIDSTSNTLSDAQLSKMDRNPFQSVNDRRNKLVTERVPVNQLQQHQQVPLQPQVVRPGVQPLGPPRSLTSANWRAHPAEDIMPQPRNMYSPFESPASHHLQHASIRPGSYPSPQVDQQHHHHHPSFMSHPNLSPLSDAQLDSNFAYCYDRGNGQYTRLIPADMLPPLQNIPAVQQSCVGMVILPQPRGLPPNGHSSNTDPVVVRSPLATTTSPADTIQSRIDNIVAATPRTPTHHSSIGLAGIGPSPSSGAPSGQRRPKIYCDKWVHEGVCAFTQQGCKYKHEMPLDRLTQTQLGLFHGFPAWWKKHQADLARQRETPSENAIRSSGASSGGGSGSGDEPRLSNDRYPGPTNSSVRMESSAGAGSGCLAMTSDAGAQLAWRHAGEYGSDCQALGPSSSMERGAISRGIGTSVRNPIVSYGSPFGPIAPPARTNTITTFETEPAHGSSAASSSTEPFVTSHYSTKKNALACINTTAPSILPTSNPYASLATLDDNNGKTNTHEGNETTKVDALRLSSTHLG
ncbi:hypothetical protein F5Y19DRAFT_242609 [Xylariaceae sp. FL1651]|nr:hypothetical protein F5Y19DRAFT_242609 [Xylariaceae sp. FL1651]